MLLLLAPREIMQKISQRTFKYILPTLDFQCSCRAVVYSFHPLEEIISLIMPSRKQKRASSGAHNTQKLTCLGAASYEKV